MKTPPLSPDATELRADHILDGLLLALPGAAMLLYDGELRVTGAVGPALDSLVAGDPVGRPVVDWMPEERRAEVRRVAEAALHGERGQVALALTGRRLDLRFVPRTGELAMVVVLGGSAGEWLGQRPGPDERLDPPTSAVVFELNNPLGYVIGNLDYAVEELRGHAGGATAGRFDQLLDVLADAREGAARMLRVVRGLHPLTPPPAGLLPASPQRPRRADGGRVLLIDDDTSVLRTLTRLLRRQHDVVAISDPRKALRRLLGGEHADAIVCDVMMPHVMGDELYRRVIEARPEIGPRFAFLGGGLGAPGRVARLDGVDRPLVEKPFDVDKLRALVRDLVDAGSMPT